MSMEPSELSLMLGMMNDQESDREAELAAVPVEDCSDDELRERLNRALKDWPAAMRWPEVDEVIRRRDEPGFRRAIASVLL